MTQQQWTTGLEASSTKTDSKQIYEITNLTTGFEYIATCLGLFDQIAARPTVRDY
jgi:hypothetical protein